MNIQRKKTKHQSFIKIVNKDDSPNGVGDYAGDSDGEEMVCGTRFPFFPF